MAATVYILGALTSLFCATLLLSAYARGRSRLLLWSGLCFTGLALSNVLIFLDLVVFTHVDLFPYRLATIAVSMALLIYGLIWESQ
jgi:hypothetical protein